VAPNSVMLGQEGDANVPDCSSGHMEQMEGAGARSAPENSVNEQRPKCPCCGRGADEALNGGMDGQDGHGNVPDILTGHSEPLDAAGARSTPANGVSQQDPQERVCRFCTVEGSESVVLNLRSVPTAALPGFDDESRLALDDRFAHFCSRCRKRHERLTRKVCVLSDSVSHRSSPQYLLLTPLSTNRRRLWQPALRCRKCSLTTKSRSSPPPSTIHIRKFH
jgi:hypothetical protein